jgi:hypothetical protein
LAANVNVDLSGATTGTLINGVGASFAETFAGQTVVGGSGISGSPTNPLTLAPSGTLDVEFWDPGVSPASNSILPEPGNLGPLSVLLASNANSITWTMGSADGSDPISVDFFSSTVALVSSQTITLNAGYSVYSVTGVGTFEGMTIFSDVDFSGLRFQNFSYNTAVPEPATWELLLLGFAGLGFAGYRGSRRRPRSPDRRHISTLERPLRGGLSLLGRRAPAFRVIRRPA